jgi:hypothetical protein
VQGIEKGYLGKGAKAKMLKEWRAEFEKWCQWVIVEFAEEDDDGDEDDEDDDGDGDDENEDDDGNDEDDDGNDEDDDGNDEDEDEDEDEDGGAEVV